MRRSKICHRLDPRSQSNYATRPKQVYNASFTIWSKQSAAWFSRNYHSRHQIKSDSCDATILQAQIWSITRWNQARVWNFQSEILHFSKNSGYEFYCLSLVLKSFESYPWRKIDEDELRKFITVASPGKNWAAACIKRSNFSGGIKMDYPGWSPWLPPEFMLFSFFAKLFQ